MAKQEREDKLLDLLFEFVEGVVKGGGTVEEVEALPAVAQVIAEIIEPY